MRTLAATLLTTTLILLLVAQFVPWATHESNGSSGFIRYSESLEVTPWFITYQGSGQMGTFGGSGSDTESWYGSDGAGADLVRIGAPMLVAAMFVSLVGLTLGFLGNRMVGPAAGAAVVLAVLGFVLVLMGINAFFEDTPLTWNVGFYLAIVAMVAALVATVISFASGRNSTPA